MKAMSATAANSCFPIDRDIVFGNPGSKKGIAGARRVGRRRAARDGLWEGMLDLVRVYLAVFGVLTVVGGVIGFVKAKSKASLVAGGISGVLLLAASYGVGRYGTPALVLGLVVSLALAARFVMAFRKSGKVMPAGLMAALGVAGVLVTGVPLFLGNR